MAESQSSDGSSSSEVSAGDSSSALHLNIKTLDSRIFSFHVDKKIFVSEFKEKIATQSGVPVSQQRLIFRGKVLKDHHPLSEYNVENGDTLHLVERQPQPASSSAMGDATPGDGGRGSDSNAGGSRNRVTPIAQSIVLGTLNIGDSADGAVPDLNRIIGAVLNTVGIGHQAGAVQHGVLTSHPNEAEASRPDAGRDGNTNPSVMWRTGQTSQSTSRAIPIQLGAGIAVPSMHMPIPDSLNTLVEFINRMELAVSQSGNQTSQPTAANDDRHAAVLPLNSRGLPTVEALSIVLERAQTLLSNHIIPTLSRTSCHLSGEAATSDPSIRGQMQMESIQTGMAMQHLGALFLELGRTILTLRLGQSPEESSVNAGPAVYISASGPNPIMVQPFPLQTSSLLGASAGVSSNHVTVNPLGVASIPRNVNIHIHAGTSLSPNVSLAANRASAGGGARGEQDSVSRPNEPGQSHGSSGVTSSASEPSRGPSLSSSGVAQSITNVQNLQSDLGVAPRQAFAGPRGGGMVQNDVSKEGSGVNEKVELPPQLDKVSNEGSSACNQVDSDGLPLGLGLGGLQPKRRHRQARLQARGSENDSTMRQGQQSRTIGQQVLQSLASLGTGRNSILSVESPASVAGATGPTTTEGTSDQTNVADAVSQLLQTPALDGLLAGVSQQTGVGTPDMFRSMLQQFTENPTMRNTMNQIARQVDGNDLGSMFSGTGGGIDLSTMMQQMMPIVSQALGGISSGPPRTTPERLLSDSRPRREIDLNHTVQSPENHNLSEDLLHSLIDRAANVSSIGISRESLHELYDRELIQDFMEMLRRDLSERLEEGKGS